MKVRITSKAIRYSGQYVINVGYCEAQTLLNFESAHYYNAGVYGWNYDVYEAGAVLICTGYRGMPGHRADYDRLREYEERAKQLILNLGVNSETRKEETQKLLQEWIAAEIEDMRKEEESDK